MHMCCGSWRSKTRALLSQALVPSLWDWWAEEGTIGSLSQGATNTTIQVLPGLKNQLIPQTNPVSLPVQKIPSCTVLHTLRHGGLLLREIPLAVDFPWVSGGNCKNKGTGSFMHPFRACQIKKTDNSVT